MHTVGKKKGLQVMWLHLKIPEKEEQVKLKITRRMKIMNKYQDVSTQNRKQKAIKKINETKSWLVCFQRRFLKK